MTIAAGMPAPNHGRVSPQVEDYFRDAGRAAARAEAAVGCIERDFLLVGLTVRLRFFGAPLVPILTRALAHAARPHTSATPDLVLSLWDSRTTGVDMPTPPWSTADYLHRGEVRDFHDGVHYTAFSIMGTILVLYNARTRQGLYWTRDANNLPYFEHGAPCRAQLGWWLTGRGCQAVHAGAVGDETGCVLLAGKGGSGKSTTALASLAAGLSYLSDDYCVIGREHDPVIYNLYSTGKVHGDDLPRIGALAADVSNVHRAVDEKALLFLHEHVPSRIAASSALKAILIPRVAQSGVTALARATPTEALLAIAPSTTSLMPYAGGEVLRNLSRIVKAVPAFQLHLGPDGPPAPVIIQSLLHSLA